LVYLLVWSPPPHIPYISSPTAITKASIKMNEHNDLLNWKTVWVSNKAL